MKVLGKAVLLVGALALMGSTACEKPKPDPGKVHREAGDAHLTKNEFSQAADEYAKALEINPDNEKLWEKKAYAHQQAGEMEKVEATLNKLAEFKKEPEKKAEVFRNLASLFLQKNDYVNAEKYFGEAAKIDPKDDVSIAWIAQMHAQRGGARDMRMKIIPEELNKAIELYEKIIALKPDDVTGYVNKRIAIGRLMEFEKQAKAASEQEAKDAKDKEKKEAATKEAEKHGAQMDEYKKQMDALSEKIKEVKAKNPAPPK